MRKIIQVIKKNYKVLLRSKCSLFILLLGPIILTFLIGFFYFNSNTFAINLGLHSPDNSDFNLFFKSELENSKFSIFEYDSQLNCEDAIKSGVIHGCIFLPKEFSINDTSNNDLILKLDTSRGDIVAVTENLINDQITKISIQIQIQNTDKLLFIINESEQLINYTSQEIGKIDQINTDLKISNNNIISQTTKFSTLFNTKELGVDELTSKYIGLNASINTMTEDGLKALNATKTNLTQALQLLDKVNSSDSKLDEADTLVSNSKSQNSIGEQKFNSIKSSYYLRQLGKIVGGVEDKLISAAKSSGDISGDVSFDLNSNSKSLDNVSGILTNINTKGDDFKTSVSTLKSKNAKTLMTPISVTTQNIVANSSVHLVSVFPSLIVGLIFIISLIMSSMFILTERKNKAHFRNFMSKNSAFNFLIGDFLSLSSIVFLQAGLIITLYHFWFLKSTDYIQFTTLLTMVIPVISIFVLIGMLIGYLTKNESSNVILTFLVILGFLTLSGKILPIEALSSSVAQIAMINPFLLGEGMIRKFLLFGVDISQMKSELILILSYSGIFLLLNFIFESFSKKRFLYGVYAQTVLGIKNSFLHSKVQTAPSSTLTSPLKRAVETTQSRQTTNANINSAPVNIPINKNNNENDVFELESLSDINDKL
jgi:hypothetical protein